MSPAPRSQNRLEIRSILVIDDHPLYCDALASTLRRLFETSRVDTASCLAEAMKFIGTRSSIDLVMLDLNLPDVTGLSGFLKIKKRIPDVPVLVFSAETSNDTVQSLMSSGAAGYVPKEASPKTLEHALEAVREGRKFIPPGFTVSAARPLDRKLSAQQMAQKIADLTPQQGRIIKLICAGKANKQIAYEMSLAEATVKAHITALLRRLGVTNRTQAAMLVQSASLESTSDMSDANARILLS